MQGGFGEKALAILTLCAMPEHDRHHPVYFRELCDKFSEKSVILKLHELHERGYIERAAVSALTPRGIHALESQPRA
jgi:hypothetical protein